MPAGMKGSNESPTPVCSGKASGWYPVRRQVFLGLLLLRLPSGVHCRAVRVMLPEHVPIPPPPCPHDDNRHAVLTTTNSQPVSYVVFTFQSPILVWSLESSGLPSSCHYLPAGFHHCHSSEFFLVTVKAH